MRVYLSSYQLGEHPDVLSDMVTGGRRGWVIANALDGGDPRRRAQDVEHQVAALARLGIDARELDLREHDPAGIAEAFGEPDMVWVRGGNVFTLRMALARSGLDAVLAPRIASDDLVYAGFSAGACVLAPSLDGLEHCDPVAPCREVYGDARFDGLGILDRPVVPHLRSPGHPETRLLGEVAARYEREGTAHWALEDGQALVIEGDAVRII